MNESFGHLLLGLQRPLQNKSGSEGFKPSLARRRRPAVASTISPTRNHARGVLSLRGEVHDTNPRSFAGARRVGQGPVVLPSEGGGPPRWSVR